MRIRWNIGAEEKEAEGDVYIPGSGSPCVRIVSPSR